jgi:hypothetical protein
MSGATALSSPRPIACPDDPQGGHQPFELQMRMVDSAVDHPLVDNLRGDLPDPLDAQPLVPGDLVIHPALAQPREDALPALGLGQDVEAPAGFWGLFQDVPPFSGKA